LFWRKTLVELQSSFATKESLAQFISQSAQSYDVTPGIGIGIGIGIVTDSIGYRAPHRYRSNPSVNHFSLEVCEICDADIAQHLQQSYTNNKSWFMQTPM
jgi:hypothetical protein